MKIYIVEDEAGIRELVYYALKSEGYEVNTFENPRDFWKQVQSQKPDLVILDVMLPGENGFATLRSLKQSRDTSHIPVIMLTAVREGEKRVEGLDLGADDYITKPFIVDELLARVRAVLRRSTPTPQSETPPLTLGPLSIDPGKRLLQTKNQVIELSFLEFELLHCLLRHKDIVMSRDQLLDQVWNTDKDGGPGDRNVDMQIRSLRKKLGPHGTMIKTIRSVGYKISQD